MATVESLEAAQKTVQEYPDGIAAVYEYHHAITGKKLYSVESWLGQGTTCSSGMVISPIKIYDGYEMQWAEAYKPKE